jgi:tetratricopeptide (TPR) repeat protein
MSKSISISVLSLISPCTLMSDLLPHTHADRPRPFWTWIGVMLIFGLAVASEVALASGSPREMLLLESAGKAVERGDIRSGISHLDAAIRLNPRNLEVYVGRGILYFRIGNIERARADFEKSLTLGDPPMESIGFLGIILALGGEVERSFELLNKAIERGFQHPLALSARGAILSNKGRLQEAVVDLSSAISMAPDLAVAWNDRGIANLRLKRFDLALSDLNQAIKLNPQLLNAYQNRSNVHMALRDYAAANRDLDHVIQVDKSRTMAYSDRAYVLSARDDYKGALRDLESAIRLEPRNPDLRNQRSRVHLSLGNEAAAVIDSSVAIDLDSKNIKRYLDRAFLLESLNNLSKAREDYTRAISLDPNSVEAYSGRAFLALREGRPDLAVPDYRRALAVEPTNLSVRGMLGTALFELGLLDEAVSNLTVAIDGKVQGFASSLLVRARAWFEKRDFKRSIADYSAAAAVMQPPDAAVLAARAYVHYLDGNLSEAIADIELAFKIDDNSVTALATRGVMRMREGKYKESVDDFSKAASLKPRDAAIYEYRASSLRSMGRLEEAVADYRVALSLDPGNARVREELELTIERSRGVLSESNESQSREGGSAQNGRRIALVIGNSKYRHAGHLSNPSRDAVSIGGALRAVGFDSVETVFDLDRAAMMAALQRFGRESSAADLSLIYFAGHGIEVGGTNYLVPVDARVDNIQSISGQLVNLEFLLQSAQRAARVSLILLDACRDNPFTTEISVKSAASRTLALGGVPVDVGRGLARVEPQPGTLVVYATKHGGVALDGDSENSPFASSLERRIIQIPAIEIRRLFDYVREDVFEATARQQQPFSYGSLPAREDFFFRR